MIDQGGTGDRAPLAPGRSRVGPYDIVDVRGHGGMAAVYLARDRRDARLVALKVLARVRPTWVQRFRREFDAARRVDHPNVVRVLEAGEYDGLAYFSMERVDGVTASRYVHNLRATDPLPPVPPLEHHGPPSPLSHDVVQRSLRVAVQLAAAVGAIHSVGLVHRDLKPGNVLVTSDGTVKLVDFGVAKWLEAQEGFTQVGHVVGSYSYMSPEQITGAEVDHRADMYGLGVVLYELLTGGTPFRAKRPQEYLWLHCTAQPEPLARRWEGFPPSLDRLPLRLLAKEAADRPESMHHVERELLAVLADFEGHPAADPPDLVPAPAARPVLIDDFENTSLAADPALAAARARRPPAAEGPESTLVAVTDGDLQIQPELSALAAPRRAPLIDPGVAALVTPKHIGRTAELEELMDHLRAARKDGVRAVLVEGEEGLGKTRLLQAFRGLAWVKGARVAIGRCHGSSGALAAPFHDLMLRLAGPGLARSHVDRVLGGDKDLLLRFFPALAATETRPPVRLSDADDLAPAFRAVAEALRRAAQDAPLVLGIEDAHWADEGTIRLVASILRRLAAPAAAPVLLVLTYRGEDIGRGERSSPLASLAPLPNVHTLTLKALQPPETEELIRSLLGGVHLDEAPIQRVVQAARGVPRVAIEVIRAVIERGGSAAEDLPDTLVQALSRRLEKLTKNARDVARCVGLLGERVPLSIVVGASSLPAADFDSALQELERRRVIDVERGGDRDLVALTSEPLRRAVLDSMSSAQRRALHRRSAASWLKNAGQNDGATGQAARHLYAAGEGRAAFPLALEAAWRAGEMLDYMEVRRTMTQMGDVTDLLNEVSSEAAYRYHMLRFYDTFVDGSLDDAAKSLEQAGSFAPDPRSRLDTGVAMARLHIRRGEYLQAVQVCRRGMREARKHLLAELAILFAVQGARAARRSGDVASAIAWLAEADLMLATRPDLETLAVRVAWTRSAVLLETRVDTEREIQSGIELAQRLHQERAEAGLRTNLSVLQWRRGDISLAIPNVERSVRIFEELGEGEQVAVHLCNLAELRLLEGRIDDAQRSAEAAWEMVGRLKDRGGMITAAASVLAVARTRMDVATAERVVEQIGDGPGPGELKELVWQGYFTERARWYRLRQQKTVAWSSVDEAARAMGRQPAEWRQREVALLRAELLWDRGQFGRALPLAEGVIAGSDAEGHLPTAWHARALLQSIHARLGRPGTLLHPPASLLAEHIPLRLTTALYQGDALRAQGQTDEARTGLREALQLARDLGFLDMATLLGRALAGKERSD